MFASGRTRVPQKRSRGCSIDRKQVLENIEKGRLPGVGDGGVAFAVEVMSRSQIGALIVVMVVSDIL